MSESKGYLDGVKPNPSLIQVVLSNSAVAALSSLSSLTSLELPGDWVKTAGAHAIASLANLQSLKMPGAEQVGSCFT